MRASMRLTVGALGALLLLCGALAFAAPAPSAHASEYQYCVGIRLEAGRPNCHDTTFHWVTRTWVRTVFGTRFACASALNGNGVITGGLVCAQSSEFISNGNYDGSRLLEALIHYEPEFESEVTYGKVNYNP